MKNISEQHCSTDINKAKPLKVKASWPRPRPQSQGQGQGQSHSVMQRLTTKYKVMKSCFQVLLHTQLIEFNSISCITHNMQKLIELSSYWQSKQCY